MAITREADGRFLVINDALLELFGLTREEAVGKTTVELGLWSAEERAEFLASVSSIPQRTFSKSRNAARTGEPIRVVLSCIRGDIDGVPCLINAATDVTGQREIEDALRKADRRKDEFLALLSHELRNPLTPILTAARLLERRVDAEGRQDVDTIVRQVKHLVRLVDDLLDMSRFTRGAVTLSKTQLDLATVVSRAVEATSPLFEERGSSARRLDARDGPRRRRRRSATDAGGRQSPLERGALHAAWRRCHRHRREGGRLGRASRPRHGRRDRHRPAARSLRHVRAGRARPRPRRGRTRHRVVAGQDAHRVARRKRVGAQRWAGTRQRVHRPASVGRRVERIDATHQLPTSARASPRRPRRESSSSTITTTSSWGSRDCSTSSDTTFARQRVRSTRSNWPRCFVRRSRSSTSACR